MKKNVFLLFLICSCLNTIAFNKNIQYGLSLQGLTNYVERTGGSDLAHKDFYKHNFGSGAINFNARYFIDDRWSLQSGIGFTAIGFDFGFAQNYSLTMNNHFLNSAASITVTQVPLMLNYSFKPNCSNKYWVVGAGFNFMFSNQDIINKAYTLPVNENVQTLLPVNYFTQTMNASKFANGSLQLMLGREKKFKRGNLLSVNLIWNIGLSGSLATTRVNYILDGMAYEHVFSNHGHYAGLSVAYLFSSKKSREKA
jgi:hypothetical protein